MNRVMMHYQVGVPDGIKTYRDLISRGRDAITFRLTIHNQRIERMKEFVHESGVPEYIAYHQGLNASLELCLAQHDEEARAAAPSPCGDHVPCESCINREDCA